VGYIAGDGEKAPEFTLAAPDGQAISWRNFRNRGLVLYFYPRDDTSGCTQEALEFSAALGEFDALGVSVLGVSRDSPDSHQRFIDRRALSVPLASDEGGEVCEAFGVWREKKLYGRTFMGVERTTFLIGPDRIIRKVWRKVRVAGHVQAVLAQARAT
jgi:peroxiredoxin Q/BCP